MAVSPFASFLIDTSQGETPQSVAKKRAMIDAMLGSRPTARYAGEGLAQLLSSAVGAYKGNKLAAVEKAGQASGNEARTRIMQSLIGGGAIPQGAPVQGNAGGGDIANQIYKGLVERGMPEHVAIGALANNKVESRLDPGINEINPVVKGSRGGFGLNQWTGPRRKAYEAFAAQTGRPANDLATQLDFTMQELQGPEKAAWAKLMQTKTPEEAAAVYSQSFLRPGIPHMDQRLAAAREFSGLMGQRPVQTASLDPAAGMQSAFAQQGQPAPFPMPTPRPQEAPQAAPVQMAQAMPQTAQSAFPAAPQAPAQGMDMQALMREAQNPWLDDQTRGFVNSLIEREMQKRDPAYQMQQQAAQIGLQKSQLELQQMQNPQPKLENVGGRLVQAMPDGSVKEVYSPPAPVQTEITDVNGKRVLVNRQTGETVRELGESPSKQQNAPAGYKLSEDGKTMERIPGYRDTNLEMDMRKEFDTQTKDFRAVRDSYNRIQASAENPTPAGDLSLIFNYMKMLDPGSVVRESEFATASNAAPLLTRYGLDAEKLKGVWEGQRLTPEQRADFLNRSNQLYAEQDQTFQSLADQYSQTATRNGLDPNNIILTPRSNPRKKKAEPVTINGYQIEQVED